MTAVFSVACLLFDQSGLDQVVERALDCAAGKAEVGCYSIYCGPAVLPTACAVAKVHINRPRPVRELIGRSGIDMAKIAHVDLPHVFSAARRHMAFSEIPAVDV